VHELFVLGGLLLPARRAEHELVLDVLGGIVHEHGQPGVVHELHLQPRLSLELAGTDERELRPV
jgi:hypothetical protein